jgi:ferritin
VDVTEALEIKAAARLDPGRKKAALPPHPRRRKRMISKKMQDALNRQINEEMYSSYLYLAMSALCEHEGFKGTAQWLRVQAREEYGHAMRIFEYVLERGGQVVLAAIQKPDVMFKSLLDIFERTLKHEQHITACIHKLADQAVAEKDHATQNLLAWFVNEQIEEEANAGDIVTRLKMAGTAGAGLLFVDSELGRRKAD